MAEEQQWFMGKPDKIGLLLASIEAYAQQRTELTNWSGDSAIGSDSMGKAAISLENSALREASLASGTYHEQSMQPSEGLTLVPASQGVEIESGSALPWRAMLRVQNRSCKT